jgi:hypothetical protein
MSSIVKYLAALGAAAIVGPGAALAAERSVADAPVKLADHELDEVTGGDGSLLDLNVYLNVMLKNIAVNVNVSNVPINAGVAVQANALGTAAQTASVQALQSVTQLQTLPGLH